MSASQKEFTTTTMNIIIAIVIVIHIIFITMPAKPRMGSCAEDTVRAGTFFRFRKVSLGASGAQLGLVIFAQIEFCLFWIFQGHF